MKKIIIIFIIFILSFTSVHALGIMPSLKIIDYDTQEHAITISIVNTEQTDRTIKLQAGGELAQYITIDQDIIYMKSTDTQKTATYRIKLPADIAPGTKSATITATEINVNEEGNVISSAMSVVHKLQINVPYNGLYAEGFLSMSETELNNPITFTASIINRGTESIKQASGHIQVTQPDGKVLYESNDKTINNIQTGTTTKLEETWTPNAQLGEYTIDYIIQYDNKNMTLTKTFNIGEYKLEIQSTEVPNFKLGTIAKYEINITNNWNNPIIAHTEVIITDENNTLVEKTDTETTTIGNGRGQATAYLDTTNIPEGLYHTKIILQYGSKTEEKDYYSILNANSIQLSEKPIIANVGNSIYSTSVIEILGCIIIVCIVIYIVRKAKKKKDLKNKTI